MEARSTLLKAEIATADVGCQFSSVLGDDPAPRAAHGSPHTQPWEVQLGGLGFSSRASAAHQPSLCCLQRQLSKISSKMPKL